MFKLCNLWPSRTTCRRAISLASLIALLAAASARAQTDGVVFVGDIEQQAMKAMRRTPITTRPRSSSPYGLRSNVPAPSERSRYPQPTVQSTSKSRAKGKQEKSWTAGVKKTLSGLFGGKSEASRPVPSLSRTEIARSIDRSSTVTPSQYKRGTQDDHKVRMAAQATSRSGEKPSMISRMTSLGSGIQQRPTTGNNQPRGLLQLWGGNRDESQLASRQQPRAYDNTRVASTSRNVRSNQIQSQPQKHDSWAGRLMSPFGGDRPAKPELANPATPKWHDSAMVAMVTDQSSTNRPDNKTQPASFAEGLVNQLPIVAGPATTTDRRAAPVQRIVAQSSSSPQAEARSNDRPAQDQANGPREIVNRHAMAAALPRPMQSTPSLKALADSKPASAKGQAGRDLRMPKNPVARPKQPTLEPSDKAVQLLTRANRLSTSARTEDDYTTVIQLCRHVLAIDDAPVAVEYSHDLASWALNRRGEVRSDEGRTKEALLDFEDALKLDPTRWRAIHNRGVIAAQAGRFADAFDDFNRTIELNPQFAKAYSNRAALYVQANKLHKASDDYHRAIELDPDLAVAHKGRGRVCHMLGQFEDALQHFDAATLLAPNDARIVNNRGDLLSDMGRYRGAMSDYRKAIALDQSLAAAYRNLAWLQATCPDKQCRNPKQAIIHAKRAMQLGSEPGDLDYDTLAAAQAAAGDFELARATMGKAIELAADGDKPNYEWRKTLYDRGEPYITEPASSIQQASYAK